MSSLNVDKSPFESAYVLTGLYYAYLKMNNVDIDSHPIKQQLSRLKSVHHKIEENKKEINTEVITRVVQHHLGVKKPKQEQI